jgi:hypothetical protein
MFPWVAQVCLEADEWLTELVLPLLGGVQGLSNQINVTPVAMRLKKLMPAIH